MKHITFILFLVVQFISNRVFSRSFLIVMLNLFQHLLRPRNKFGMTMGVMCLFVIGKANATVPKQIVVGPEDTVYGIAWEYGLSTHKIIAANNLKKPFILKQGQILIIPSPNEHIIGDGETLETIAENYGVKADVLAQENNIESPAMVNPGNSLSIPSRDTESLAEALRPPSQEIATSSLAPLPLVKSIPAPNKPNEPLALSNTPAPSPKAEKIPLPDDLAEELAREGDVKRGGKTVIDYSDKPAVIGNLAQGNVGAPIAASEPIQEEIKEEIKPKKEVKKEDKKETKKKEVASKGKLFIWPVEGTVISKFSASGKNDGINIKVEEGTLVKAAAAGEVMYSGSELKGFGNLLLIKHKDGWMTAYAHNSDLLVKKGDTVKQGQGIAKSGSTGDVKEPQLHFEIRKGKQPVDPLPKLES